MYVEAVGIYHSYRQTKAEGLSQWLLSARIAKQQSNSSMEVVMDSAQHSSSVLGGSPPLRTSARILRSGASAGCSCRILRQEIDGHFESTQSDSATGIQRPIQECRCCVPRQTFENRPDRMARSPFNCDSRA